MVGQVIQITIGQLPVLENNCYVIGSLSCLSTEQADQCFRWGIFHPFTHTELDELSLLFLSHYPDILNPGIRLCCHGLEDAGKGILHGSDFLLRIQ